MSRFVLQATINDSSIQWNTCMGFKHLTVWDIAWTVYFNC